MPLTDQVAIVTGGGRGIGLACVRALADDGASVVIATPEDAERPAAVAELEAKGHAALGTSTDVTSESDLAELVSATLPPPGKLNPSFYSLENCQKISEMCRHGSILANI